MTAAREPAPGYADADDPLGQVAVDVDALRRRLDEQQATLRRNHAALTQLAESVGKVVEMGRRRDRRAGFNSFVAYILFTVLLGGGALLLYRSRAADLVRARDDAKTDLAATRTQLQAVQAELQARDDAARRAYGFYSDVRDGKRAEALATYGALANLPLTPTEREVLADGEKQARAKMVDAGWEAGLDAFHKGDFARAVVELRRAENYETGGANAAQMHYYLGVALVRAKDADAGAAVDELHAAIADKTDQPDVRYWLAVALEAVGKPADARREYEKFAAAQPMAPLAGQARARWTALGQPPGGAKPAP